MKAVRLLLVALLLTPAGAQSERVLQQLGVDVEKATIPLDEIFPGGPPPQGIPAIGFEGLPGVAGSTPPPRFVPQEDAASWLRPNEPVIAVSLGGETKAYPLQILMWHEIANDAVGGVPVAVTFCPLCNSALAFDRRVGPDDEPVTFGVSGLLYLSNLLMFDDRTETLWSQLIGEGVVGDLAGEQLERYPAPILAFEEFRKAYPEAMVMSRDTGFDRPYGRNPYVGYDDAHSPPFLFRGESDDRLPPKARVVAIDAEEPVAYPFEELEAARVIHDELSGTPIVVFWEAGTTSALDAPQIGESSDVGAAAVFERELAGRTLTFEWTGESFVDAETGTSWSITGRGLEGPLAGEQLEPVVHDNTLWFAWAAFRPETRLHVD